MPQQSVFGDRSRSLLLQRLAVVGATILAGLLASAALLAALGGPVSNALAAPAGVTRIYPGAFPCDTTLQFCIKGSFPGDTVVVLPGHYTESLTLNQAVNLTGVSSATVTLHAVANQRVLVVAGAAVDSSVIISGLTLAGGHAVGGTCPAGCGGAILITGTAQPLLINLTISNSRADIGGGGVHADIGSLLVMSGVAVLSNTTGDGGGGADAGGGAILNGGSFQNNRCTGAACLGGGLVSGNSVTLNGGLFQNNQCTGAGCRGGGLFVAQDLAVNNTLFLSNTSNGDGGGAYVAGIATLNGGLFQGNQCTGADCRGGGLFMQFAGPRLTATNSQFLGNISQGDGGGAYVSGDVFLNGGLFQNNQCIASPCVGGGLSAFGNLTEIGSLFLGNTSNNHGGGVLTVGPATLFGGQFEGNQCTGPICQGGGLFAGSTLSAINAVFENNSSTNGGGGVRVIASATMNGAVFADNQCTGANCQGGGLFAGNSLTVTKTRFELNRGQQGAGLYQSKGTGSVVNDLFSANQAGLHGDAVFLASPGAVSMLFTTIASPTVGGGSAIYVTSGTVGVTDTLIASYSVGIENAGGNVREDYNLFSGLATSISGTLTIGGHSHPGAANFVNPTVGAFNIFVGSAAIDVGVDAGIYFDFYGDPRPLGDGFDIGYDEANIRHQFLSLVRR